MFVINICERKVWKRGSSVYHKTCAKLLTGCAKLLTIGVKFCTSILMQKDEGGENIFSIKELNKGTLK